MVVAGGMNGGGPGILFGDAQQPYGAIKPDGRESVLRDVEVGRATDGVSAV